MSQGRYAFICPHKDHEGHAAAYRVFVGPDDPAPECPRHGKMHLQRNRPYTGTKPNG